MDCNPPGSCPWDYPGKHTGVDCHSLLQRIFPIQGSNPGLLHFRQILYHLSNQGDHDKEDYKDSPGSSRGIYRHLQRLLVEHIQHFVILTLLIFHNMLFLKLFFFLKLFKGMTEDEMAGWHHRLDGHGFGWTPGVDGGQGGLACCNSWGRRVGHD